MEVFLFWIRCVFTSAAISMINIPCMLEKPFFSVMDRYQMLISYPLSSRMPFSCPPPFATYAHLISTNQILIRHRFLANERSAFSPEENSIFPSESVLLFLCLFFAAMWTNQRTPCVSFSSNEESPRPV